MSVDETEYRALRALSGTGIAELLRSPAVYRWRLDHPEPPSPAMRLGTLVHSLALGTEPTAVVSPFSDFRTREAREWRDAQTLDVVTRDEWDRAERIAEAVHAHPAARALLRSDGMPEVTVMWTEGDTPCKGRIDWLAGAQVVDLKTTRDIDGFGRSIGTYGYHAQVMHYRRGVTAALGLIDPPLPILVAVETDPPHRVGVWRLSERDAAQGEAMCEEAYRRWADCTEAGVWPTGLPDDIAETDIPTWALRVWDDRIGGDDYLAAETVAALEDYLTGGAR